MLLLNPWLSKDHQFLQYHQLHQLRVKYNDWPHSGCIDHLSIHDLTLEIYHDLLQVLSTIVAGGNAGRPLFFLVLSALLWGRHQFRWSWLLAALRRLQQRPVPWSPCYGVTCTDPGPHCKQTTHTQVLLFLSKGGMWHLRTSPILPDWLLVVGNHTSSVLKNSAMEEPSPLYLSRLGTFAKAPSRLIHCPSCNCCPDFLTMFCSLQSSAYKNILVKINSAKRVLTLSDWEKKV